MKKDELDTFVQTLGTAHDTLVEVHKHGVEDAQKMMEKIDQVMIALEKERTEISARINLGFDTINRQLTDERSRWENITVSRIGPQ